MCQLLGGMTIKGEAMFAACMLLQKLIAFHEAGVFSPPNGNVGFEERLCMLLQSRLQV